MLFSCSLGWRQAQSASCPSSAQPQGSGKSVHGTLLGCITTQGRMPREPPCARETWNWSCVSFLRTLRVPRGRSPGPGPRVSWLGPAHLTVSPGRSGSPPLYAILGAGLLSWRARAQMRLMRRNVQGWGLQAGPARTPPPVLSGSPHSPALISCAGRTGPCVQSASSATQFSVAEAETLKPRRSRQSLGSAHQQRQEGMCSGVRTPPTPTRGGGGGGRNEPHQEPGRLCTGPKRLMMLAVKGWIFACSALWVKPLGS